MSNSINEIFECDNLVCKLRFPGNAEYPRRNRCPVCRSSIQKVATVKNRIEMNKQIDIHKSWQVEAMLDNIRSAWNVGSIFRTSDGIGIQKLYLCGITPSPENTKVSKTALGAEFNIAWEKSNNGVHMANLLKAKGYVLWALEDLPMAQPLFQIKSEWNNSPIVLIVGNEVSGIDPGIIEICDKVVSIPMVGKKQSYNVAVAYGIAVSFLLYCQSVSHGSFSIFPST